MGTVTCSLMICLTVYTAIFNLVNGTDSIPVYVTALVVIILALCMILIRKEDIPGAIILIIASGGAPLYLQGIQPVFQAWLLLGTPFVISAIFLFTAGILSNEKQPA
jgi:hypothetical protein